MCVLDHIFRPNFSFTVRSPNGNSEIKNKVFKNLLNEQFYYTWLIHHLTMRGIRPAAKLGDMVHRRLLLSDTRYKFWGFPEPMLRSHNLLEGFIELTESCQSHDYWLLQGKYIDFSLLREETHLAKSGKVPDTEHPLSSLYGIRIHYFPSTIV